MDNTIVEVLTANVRHYHSKLCELESNLLGLEDPESPKGVIILGLIAFYRERIESVDRSLVTILLEDIQTKAMCQDDAMQEETDGDEQDEDE